MRWPVIVVWGMLVVSLSAEPAAEHLQVRLDSGAAQTVLDRATRATLGPSGLLLTPQFEVVDVGSGVRAPLKNAGWGLWTADLDIPPPADVHVLQRLALVPLPSAGPDATSAIVLLQDLWAAQDPWPLVRGVLAWAWAERDPRFNKVKNSLELRFPPP